jgi:microcompartment protein CcmK/EutM
MSNAIKKVRIFNVATSTYDEVAIGASGENVTLSTDPTKTIEEVVNEKADDTIFKGATGSSEGEKGLVPAPALGETEKYLKSDGTWGSPAGGVTGVKGSAEIDYRTGNVEITAANIGLGDVGNFKAVSTVASQGLSATEQENARANIGAGTSSLVLGETSSNAYRGDYGKIAYDHSQTDHARVDATKTEASSTNGNIKINGTETTVYTHPGSGTNPHGTTKSDIGLGNVGNFKAVSTVASQGLTETEKANARSNIGAGSSSFSGSYNDLTDKPTLGTSAAKDVATSGDASTTQVVMGNDSRLTDARKASDVSAWAKASTKPTYTATEVGAIPSTQKGSASGVAELDANGKVPSAQLPSFVDDVIDGYLYNNKFYEDSAHTKEITGESGKIYINISTNKTYRWSGSGYAEISESLALGETSTTAYRGDRGKTAYDHSQAAHARTDATKTEASSTNGNIKINGTETTVYMHPGSGTNPHGTTKSDVGLGNVGNFKAVSTVASQGLSNTEKSNARANIGAGTSSLTIGSTATTAAAGNHTHTTTIAADSGTNQLSLAANTKYKITTGGTSYVFTTPPDTNTTYKANTTSIGSASGWSAGSATTVTVSGDTLKITQGTAPSLTITSKTVATGISTT